MEKLGSTLYELNNNILIKLLLIKYLFIHGLLYLSHCCIMEISLMISCRSDSTGTCLMATTWPDSLWMALKTLPYDLNQKAFTMLKFNTKHMYSISLKYKSGTHPSPSFSRTSNTSSGCLVRLSSLSFFSLLSCTRQQYFI